MALVGEPPRFFNSVCIVDYDPACPERYAGCRQAANDARTGVTVRCSRVVYRVGSGGFMRSHASAEPLLLRVGGLTRSDLKGALALAGVQLNAYAEMLLEDAVFDRTEAETVEIIQRTVTELGLVCGTTLPRILATAREHGLLPCPPVVGPYLRLAMSGQTTASDSVLSSGRAPTGSVTVASEPLGYRCGDDHLWSPNDRFAFRLSAQTPAT